MNTGFPSKKLDVTGLPQKGTSINLDGGKAELDLLSQALGVERLHSFRAEINAKPWKLKGAYLAGLIKATVEQTCVATLEPVITELDCEFERYFLPQGDPALDDHTIVEGELVIDPEEDDIPDELDGKFIDMWSVVIEELNLQIDPFPRTQAASRLEDFEQATTSDTHKPFADLKTLITQKKARE
ncbi:MAG: DUF177 domain-containing protein [Pseudomonadota bacterium]